MKNSKTTNAIIAGSLVAGALFGSNNNVNAADLLKYNDLGSAGQIRSVLLNDFSDILNGNNAFELKCGESKKTADAKCGESKKMKDGKCGESKKMKDGKCGESKKMKDGKCGEGKKMKDGKCGEEKKKEVSPKAN